MISKNAFQEFEHSPSCSAGADVPKVKIGDAVPKKIKRKFFSKFILFDDSDFSSVKQLSPQWRFTKEMREKDEHMITEFVNP